MTIRQEAKFYLKETLNEEGFFNEERARVVCDYILESKQSSRALKVAKLFNKLVAEQIKKDKAIVEYAGELSPEIKLNLEAYVKAQMNRDNLMFEYKLNEGLVAGVRIRCADYLWEKSTALDLLELRKALK